MILITVAGGVGQESREFRKAFSESVCLLSPDNTPMYDFNILNANGMLVVGANGITAQRTKINETFQLDGLCTLYITNAVDDGVYSVEIFTK